MIFRLTKELVFPDPALADPDGLLAIGGDLSAERLLLAYKNGIFPWFNEDDPILWFSPHQRCVLFPDTVYVSGSMKTLLRSGKFRVSTNTAFEDVIKNCAVISRGDQEGTWITVAMQEAYIAMHKINAAHSVEVWEGDKLVGGLYGVVVNNVFCGESMFSKASNASKTALIWLCKNGGYALIDCQLPNEHLMRMGAEMISRTAYQEVLSLKSGQL